MHILGVGGHMRRIYNPTQYEFLQPLQHWNVFMTVSAIVPRPCRRSSFAINFFYSLFAGPKAERNPWHANTLEWEAPTPAPHGNFLEHPDRLPRSVRVQLAGREGGLSAAGAAGRRRAGSRGH